MSIFGNHDAIRQFLDLSGFQPAVTIAVDPESVLLRIEDDTDIFILHDGQLFCRLQFLRNVLGAGIEFEHGNPEVDEMERNEPDDRGH